MCKEEVDQSSQAGLEVGSCMNFESSSYHQWTGDQELNIWQRYAWLGLNACVNRIPLLGRAAFEEKVFKVDRLDVNWKDLPPKATPSRALSNAFWIHLPWGEIDKELNGIGLLDVGCGKGWYGELIYKHSQKRLRKYVGVDHQRTEQWDVFSGKYDFMDFYEADCEKAYEWVDASISMLISQSAIEHFRRDLIFLN